MAFGLESENHGLPFDAIITKVPQDVPDHHSHRGM